MMTQPWRVTAPLAALAVLTGCSDGEAGSPGAPGEVLPPVSHEAQVVHLTVQQTQFIDGKLAVSFNATNEYGVALVGLQDVRATLAKLVDSAQTDGRFWQSYLRTATDVDGDKFPGVDNVSHASSDKKGQLVDSGDGNYQFTFSVDVLQMTDPITGEAIPWQQELLHRVGLELRASDNYPVANASYDWLPNGEMVSDGLQVAVVESCNQCHTEFSAHGGSRTRIENCVTCHNPGNVDPISGESLDLKAMVHKLHHGIDLPSLQQQGRKHSLFVKDGKSEIVYAENDGIWVLNNKGTIDGINYPQEIRNCAGCHADEADLALDPSLQTAVTADGGLWKHNPTIEACASCHDTTAFNQQMLDSDELMVQHVAFPVEDADCLACHGDGNTFAVDKVHTVAALAKADFGKQYGYRFEVTKLTPVSATAYDVHVWASKDGVGVGLDDPYLQHKNSTRLLLNWDNGQGFETHVGKKTPNSFELDASELCRAGAQLGELICTWDTALDPYINDGQPLTSGHILTTFISSGVCVNSRNELVDCEANNPEEKISSPSTVVNRFFDAASLQQAPDQQVKFGADWGSCNSCHGEVIQHDSRRSDDVAQCKACHNANRFTRSPADSPRDGGSSDLKFEVHKIHSNHLYRDADNNFDMVGRNEFYPAPISDCSQCHSQAQIDLPLQQNWRPSISRAPTTSLDDGTTLVRDGAVYTSPIAAVCSSCHLSVGPGLIGSDGKVVTDANGDVLLTRDLSSNGVGYDNGEFPQRPVTITAGEQQLVNHMITMGGAVFGATSVEAATDTESCAVCHANGKEVGVDRVHLGF